MQPENAFSFALSFGSYIIDNRGLKQTRVDPLTKRKKRRGKERNVSAEDKFAGVVIARSLRVSQMYGSLKSVIAHRI